MSDRGVGAMHQPARLLLLRARSCFSPRAETAISEAKESANATAACCMLHWCGVSKLTHRLRAYTANPTLALQAWQHMDSLRCCVVRRVESLGAHSHSAVTGGTATVHGEGGQASRPLCIRARPLATGHWPLSSCDGAYAESLRWQSVHAACERARPSLAGLAINSLGSGPVKGELHASFKRRRRLP